MSTTDRHTASPSRRPARLAVWGAAVIAAVAGGAAMMAAPGTAAPTLMGWNLYANDEVGAPRLDHGVLRIEGSGAGELIALRLQEGQPGFLQVDFGDNGSAEFTIDRSGVESITLDAGGGDDSVRIDESNGRFTDVIPTTIDGGGGGDRLFGGSGAETLEGGGGSDTIDGNRGNDVGLMGGGKDTFVWDPGDGSDVVEGGGGHDTMLFNGANVAERVELTANGNRLRFFRDPAGITMDTHDVEQVDFVALAGADVVTVDDLRGSGVRQVNVVAAADGAADRVIVTGTDHDRVTVSGDSDAVQVEGLRAAVSILHPEGGFDRLEINGLGAARVANDLPAGTIGLFVDGVAVP